MRLSFTAHRIPQLRNWQLSCQKYELPVRNMNSDQNDKESMFKSKTPLPIKSCLNSYRFNFRVQKLAFS